MDVGQSVLPTIQTEECRLRIQVYNGFPLSLLAVANSLNRLTIVALLAPLTECEHQRFHYIPRFCCVPLGRCWSLLTKKSSTALEILDVGCFCVALSPGQLPAHIVFPVRIATLP